MGLYVLAGQVASGKSGPAVVVSYAIAAFASLFSALCYAEFAARVPRAGSAYAYSYITVGEFCAFLIGFNMILEYVIGASSVAKGFSGYLRVVYQQGVAQVTNKQAPNFIQDKLVAAAKTNNSSSLQDSTAKSITESFDLLVIVIIIVVTCLILFGLKESTNITIVFTAINLIVVIAVIVNSLPHLSFTNWNLNKNQVPKSAGSGGFMPFGWSGVFAGSGTCFFAFIGFDTVASSAEEAKNPRRDVPLAIVLSMLISCCAYMAMATIQTLLWPYYQQNEIVILPQIFRNLHMPITCWLVLIGALAGLASSQLGGLYPLPRTIYSMANDKLIYSYFSKLNSKKLPMRATIAGSLMIVVLASLLEVEELADFVSIGTLLAYSLVAISVLILRYEYRSNDDVDNDNTNHIVPQIEYDIKNIQRNEISRQQQPQTSLQPTKPNKQTTAQSKKAIRIIISLIVISCTLIYFSLYLTERNHIPTSIKVVIGLLLAFLLVTILRYVLILKQLPTNKQANYFQTPFMPFTPIISITINVYLMLNLSYMTWLRFAAWLSLGLFIYFTYGIRNSTLASAAYLKSSSSSLRKVTTTQS